MAEEVIKRKIKLSEIPIKQRNILIARSKNKYITILLILLFGPFVYKFYLGKIAEGIGNIFLFIFFIILIAGSSGYYEDLLGCITWIFLIFLVIPYAEMILYIFISEENFHKRLIKKRLK